jgi:hypothetical protein
MSESLSVSQVASHRDAKWPAAISTSLRHLSSTSGRRDLKISIFREAIVSKVYKFGLKEIVSKTECLPLGENLEQGQNNSRH